MNLLIAVGLSCLVLGVMIGFRASESRQRSHSRPLARRPYYEAPTPLEPREPFELQVWI